MGDVFSAAIGGGLSLLGGVMANNASSAQAQANRDWQERMSNTAHQREVSDLRAAGLNPILSGTGGSGAGTPSGNVAPQSDVVTPAISTAMQLLRTSVDTNKTLADTELVKAQKEIATNNTPGLIDAQAGQASSATAINRIDADKRSLELGIMDTLKQNTVDTAKLQKAILDQNYEVAKAEALDAKNKGSVSSGKFGEIMSYIERFLRPFAPFVKAR